MLEVQSSTLSDCSARDAATGSGPGVDFRLYEGFGGGIHASAGGCLQTVDVTLLHNTAVHGGGLSVKSGSAVIQGALVVRNNSATGKAADGYGNGGGILVTTSFHDDAPPTGAGWGAATLYAENGTLTSSSSSVQISDNRANRWGGGLYAGISTVLYSPFDSNGAYDTARVELQNATVANNVASATAALSGKYPSQIAVERVDKMPGHLLEASLVFGGTTVTGDASRDIGYYSRQSLPVGSTVSTTLPITNE
jgi:hypothetical protein